MIIMTFGGRRNVKTIDDVLDVLDDNREFQLAQVLADIIADSRAESERDTMLKIVDAEQAVAQSYQQALVNIGELALQLHGAKPKRRAELISEIRRIAAEW